MRAGRPWTVKYTYEPNKNRKFYSDEEFRNALLVEERELAEKGRPLIDPEWKERYISNARTGDEWHAVRGN